MIYFFLIYFQNLNCILGNWEIKDQFNNKKIIEILINNNFINIILEKNFFFNNKIKIKQLNSTSYSILNSKFIQNFTIKFDKYCTIYTNDIYCNKEYSFCGIISMGKGHITIFNDKNQKNYLLNKQKMNNSIKIIFYFLFGLLFLYITFINNFNLNDNINFSDLFQDFQIYFNQLIKKNVLK